MSSLDYLDLCRLCLVKDQVSVSIFDDGESKSRHIYPKIVACLSVKVDPEDKLPKKICDGCAYKLDLFYDFYNTTATAEKQLWMWLEGIGLEDKQNYIANDMNSSLMKQEQGENRLNVAQASAEHQNMSLNMIDNMGLTMPIIMSPDQAISVPISSSETVQTVQSIAGPSLQSQMARKEREDDEETTEDDNTEDEIDHDEGLPVKEEHEDGRIIEPTTFVNVTAMACDEAGPSGLQQKLPEMTMQAADVDPKSGCRARQISRGKKSKRVHECAECGAYFFHMTKLVEHLKNAHAIKNAFNCDECGKPFRSPMNITRHKLIHTGEKNFSCDICGYTCNQKTNLELHKRRHAGDFTYKCGICDKGFIQKSELVEHENTHVAAKYRCEICNKTYSYRKNLKAHLRLHHQDGSIMLQSTSNHSCKICQETFVLAALLKSHMKNYHGVTTTRCQFLCDLCGIKVSSRRDLQVHMRTHTGEKIANCEICGKGFSTKWALKIHRRSHTGEKPYICDQCGKDFSQRNSLVIHLRYHTGERPYWCPDCGKGFVTKNFLTKHQKIHGSSSSTFTSRLVG